MINISDEVRAKIQSGQALTHAKIVFDDHVFGYDDRDKTLPPKDDGSIHKLEIESDLAKDEFAIGTACLQCCDVMLYGAVDFEFENKLFKVYIGYELDERYIVNNQSYPQIEWLPMGTFFARDIIKKKKWVSFTGYDRMYRLTDMIYVPSSSLESKPNIYDVFLDIFKFTGDPYDIDSFASMMSANVDMKLLYGTEEDGSTTGYSVRDALAFLSGKVGGCVTVNRYDKFEFVEYSFATIQVDDGSPFLNEHEYLITDGDVSNFEIMGDGVHGMRYIDAANSSAMVRYDNGSNKYKNGIVLDSPIISTEKEAKNVLDRVNNIYINHGGIFYMTPCYFNLMNGDVSLDIGDIIAYVPDGDVSDKAYIPIMHLKITYIGKPSIEIASYNQTEIEQANRTISLGRSFTAFKRASNNRYKYLDEAIEIVSKQITGADGGYIVVDKNEDGSWRQIRVLDDDKNPTTAIVINKNGIGFSQDGGKTMNSAAITIDGKLVANSMTGGVLQAAQGEIGGWRIEPDGLYSDYGNWRIYLQPAYNNDGAANRTWVLSTQYKGNDGIYYGTYILYADGRQEHFEGSDYYHQGTSIRAGSRDDSFNMIGTEISNDLKSIDIGDENGSKVSVKSPVLEADNISVNGKLTFNQYVCDGYGYEVINANSNNALVFGYGQYTHKTPTHIYGNDIHFYAQGATLTFGSQGWKFDGDTDFVNRNTLESAGGFVLSANEGNNGMYLKASTIYLAGNTKINFKAVSGTIPLVVNTSGLITPTSSSKRYKENITENLEDWINPQKLYDLPVVQYNYKDKYKDIELVSGTQIGITAEDVNKYYPNACIYNEKGEPESWQDRIMIPAMLKLIQEQKKEIDALNDRVTALENAIKNRAD